MDSKPPPNPNHTGSDTQMGPSTSKRKKVKTTTVATASVPQIDFETTQWKPFKEILEALQRKYQDNPDPLATYADRVKTSYSNMSVASVATVMSIDEERTMAEVKRLRDRYFVNSEDENAAAAAVGDESKLPTTTTRKGAAVTPGPSTGATPKIPPPARQTAGSPERERREFASFFNSSSHSAGRGRRFTSQRFDADAAAWAHGIPMSAVAAEADAANEPVATGNRKYRRSLRFQNLYKFEHRGFNPHFSKTSMSRLLRSLRNGDIRVLREELNIHEMDVNRTINGRFAIHYAADHGQYDMLRFLLDNGANVNARDDYGITPLLVCIWEGHTRCVELLLNSGACSDGRTPDGRTYIEEAQKPEIRELLRRPNTDSQQPNQ